MSGAGFLRIAKPTGAGIVLAAARHNKRAIQAEAGAGSSIDPARSTLNYRLAGPESPQGVAELASCRMKAAGLGKLRKNAVRAIELVFSLPVDTGIDHRVYFADCVRWAGDRFGGTENVLSADVHLDESAPHCHVLILPLIEGRMVGSDMVGGPKALAGHLTSFHGVVASPHGLRRAPVRMSTQEVRAMATAVFKRLCDMSDPVLRSIVWAAVRDAIERDPMPWASTLGLPLGGRSGKPMKSMTAIFTSPGKGPKRERESSTHIGFGTAADDQTLCSVGFGQESIQDPTLRVTPDQLGAEERGGSPQQRPGDLSQEPAVTKPVSMESSPEPDKRAGAEVADQRLAHTGRARCAVSIEPSKLGCQRGDRSRLRGSEHSSTSWCEERGEFIDAVVRTKGSARLAAESWVNGQLSGAR